MKLTLQEEKDRKYNLSVMNSNGWPKIVHWYRLLKLTIKKYSK